jgi:hypothetical protein
LDSVAVAVVLATDPRDSRDLKRERATTAAMKDEAATEAIVGTGETGETGETEETEETEEADSARTVREIVATSVEDRTATLRSGKKTAVRGCSSEAAMGTATVASLR